ncbi:plasma membrane iron permease [Teratosphaeria destructans]|uniref:Plasma membrane iron permease n=1 Tax=Teratosphaeria destructans TaxID=418781 RepID=A0A9W7SWJ5_9PEZI|nr:plasma membrane iron permease [Teratosphaeria destructans]
MTVNVFAVPIFFVCFRECIEVAIIVSILLSFLKKTIGPERDRVVYNKLRRQVWLGVGLGMLICLIIGSGMIGAWYGFGKDHFAKTEDIWEGTFALIATLIITLVGAALLRVSKLQDKWRVKLAKALEKKDLTAHQSAGTRMKMWSQKYSMFLLPFITVLREGLETVVFIGGVGLSLPATSFPLAVVCGIVGGVLVGYLIYKGGNTARLQIFLIISTCFLYLVAAGLFSKAVWYFENQQWSNITGGDAAETGSGAGSYNIKKSVWHVNCCNPLLNGGGGWGIFNAILGWQNSATYGTVISYNLYWLAIIVWFVSMRYYEQKGHWPLMKPKKGAKDAEGGHSSEDDSSGSEVIDAEKKIDETAAPATTTVRELRE